jgi:hypothetical protein
MRVEFLDTYMGLRKIERKHFCAGIWISECEEKVVFIIKLGKVLELKIH